MTCKKCSDRGYLLNNKKEFIGFCDCLLGIKHKKSFWERSLSNAGIFSEYWYKTMRDFIVQANQPSHVDFVNRTGQTIGMIDTIHNTNFIWAIYGTNGVGKTLAASLVLIEAVRKGYTAKYIVWIELLRKRINLENDEAFMHGLKTVDFLAIDEINGDSFDKPKFPAETLEVLMKYRYSNQKPTIIILKDDIDVVSKKLPVLNELVSEKNISKVIGLNFRKDSVR